MIYHKILLFSLLLFILFLIFYSSSSSSISIIVEKFIPGKFCTNPKASNYTDPINIIPPDTPDNCTCIYPNNKIICSRYFATNFQEPNYSNPEQRCHDTNSYNFEINTKIPNNDLCQFENNDTCIFPVSLSNVNSLFDIINNPDEFVSIHDKDFNVNYNNILRAGPCISKKNNRNGKLELYYRLFNRDSIKPMNNYLDPIFNLWDLSGKITYDQLKAEYGAIIRTYNFVEENISTTIDVQGYNLQIPFDSDYSTIVNKFNNTTNTDHIKHVALAVSKNGSKYAIGIGKTKDAAMDIAFLNALLYDDNDKDRSGSVDRSYTRYIFLIRKAKLMDNILYQTIKRDIIENKIVKDEDRLLVFIKDKLFEDETNPIGILMLNNERYFKYNNDPSTLDKCIDQIKNINSTCYNNNNNKIIAGEPNCNEAILLRYDKSNNKCNIVQNSVNIIKNSDYDLSKSKNLKELTVNAPIKIINNLMENNCNNDNVNCFIYSVNDKRFCKG